MKNNSNWYAITYDDGFWNWTKITPESLPYIQQGFDVLNGVLPETHSLYIWPRDADQLMDMFKSVYDELADQRESLRALLGVHDDS